MTPGNTILDPALLEQAEERRGQWQIEVLGEYVVNDKSINGVQGR
jgi:hypothetical protein